MDLNALWTAFAQMIGEIPRSGLLAITVGAIVGSTLGGALARRRVPLGAALGNLSTLVLGAVLIVIVLQVSRFDPRIDIAVPELGMPEQVVAGGETRVPMARDGHFWVQATVNGYPARFLVDTGATLTAVTGATAQRAGLTPRESSLPVRIVTANGTVTAQLTSIDDLAFGNVSASGLDAVIAPNLGETNVIGMNLLSRLGSWRVEGQTLILTPRKDEA